MYALRSWFITAAVFVLSSLLSANELDIARLVASPSLSGPVAKGVEISPDGSRVTFLQGKKDDQYQQDLWEYHIADGEKRMLVDSRALVAKEQLDEVERARRERARIFATGIIEYSWSPDSRALLFPLGGDLYFLQLGSEPKRLTATDATETDARISPKGKFVSFIREQNLYVIDLATGEERALTSTGGDAISYGMAEFVAQEEMYRNTGYWWAKDDSRIAYARIDESNVVEKDRYEINSDGVTAILQRYPFAGTANAQVELLLQNLSNGEERTVSLGDNPNIYLARADFSPDGTLAVQIQSRDQQTLDLVFVNPVTGEQKQVLREEQPNWINLHDDLNFLSGGEQFIWSSERSGHNQLYLYQKDGSLIRQLTDNNWSVAGTDRTGAGVRAVDEKSGMIWFSGYSGTALEKQLYRVSLENGAAEQMTPDGGWYDAKVAANGSFYVENGQGPLRPPYTAIRSAKGELLTYITENALDETHAYYPYLADHRAGEFGTLAAEDGTLLNYQITKPADFDPAKKYPAIVYLYGGPGGPEVTHQWPIDGRLQGLNQVLARNGHVVFTLDNRGTGNRGKAFADVIYRNMGNIEVRDQITGINWLKSQAFVDAKRIGMHGWSYGGYMTLMTLLQHPGTLKAGIAGAPVTNWRLYDTHYTERYMGDPNDGAGKYELSSPMSYASNLTDPLLIIRGMADDNVFFDHTVQMITALQQAAQPFEMMAYPGKRHRITGEAETTQLWNLYLDFFGRYLQSD